MGDEDRIEENPKIGFYEDMTVTEWGEEVFCTLTDEERDKKWLELQKKSLSDRFVLPYVLKNYPVLISLLERLVHGKDGINPSLEDISVEEFIPGIPGERSYREDAIVRTEGIYDYFAVEVNRYFNPKNEADVSRFFEYLVAAQMRGSDVIPRKAMIIVLPLEHKDPGGLGAEFYRHAVCVGVDNPEAVPLANLEAKRIVDAFGEVIVANPIYRNHHGELGGVAKFISDIKNTEPTKMFYKETKEVLLSLRGKENLKMLKYYSFVTRYGEEQLQMGLSIGRAEGFSEGRSEEREEMIKSMASRGKYPEQEIADVCRCSVDEVRRVLNKK